MRLGSLVIASFAAARVAAAQIPTMVVSPPSVTYTVPTGSVWSSDVPVSITSDGASISGLTRTIAYGASQPTSWLKATLSGSGTPAILSFQVDAALLVPGTYDATVTVKSKLTGVAPQAIAVKLTVTAAPPAIAVARTATLTAIAGSLIPVDLKLDVTNGGGGKLSGLQSAVTYPNGEITGWLTAALGSPDAPTMLNLRATPIQSLLGGVHHASVVITAKGTSNSPQTVDVSFNVTGLNPAMQLTPSTVSFFGIIGTGGPAPPSATITNVRRGRPQRRPATLDHIRPGGTQRVVEGLVGRPHRLNSGAERVHRHADPGCLHRHRPGHVDDGVQLAAIRDRQFRRRKQPCASHADAHRARLRICGRRGSECGPSVHDHERRRPAVRSVHVLKRDLWDRLRWRQPRGFSRRPDEQLRRREQRARAPCEL